MLSETVLREQQDTSRLLVLILIDSIAAMVSEFSGDGTNISHAAHFGR